MNKRLELAQDRVIEKVGNLCSRFGLNHFMAQLYVVLYMSRNSLSLDDLVQRLRVSKGNVSVNIRELERWGAVRKVWVKGSRRDFYEAELNIRKVLAERIGSSVQKRIDEVSAMLEEFKDTVKSAGSDLTEEERESAKLCVERLKKIEELQNLASNALRLASKVL